MWLRRERCRMLGWFPCRVLLHWPQILPGAPWEHWGSPSLRRSSRLGWDYHKRWLTCSSGEGGAPWSLIHDDKLFIRLLLLLVEEEEEQFNTQHFYRRCEIYIRIITHERETVGIYLICFVLLLLMLIMLASVNKLSITTWRHIHPASL